MYNLYNLEANYTINRNFRNERTLILQSKILRSTLLGRQMRRSFTSRKRDISYHLAEIFTAFLFLSCLIFWLFI